MVGKKNILINFPKKSLVIRSKFTVKWLLKIPPHLPYVAALPCETLVSAKQAINDRLLGSTSYIFKVWWNCQ